MCAHNHGVCFGSTNYSRSWCLPRAVVDKPSDKPLKKTDFQFPSRYQFQTVSGLGVELCIHISLSLLGFCLTELVQILGTFTVSMSSRSTDYFYLPYSAFSLTHFQ